MNINLLGNNKTFLWFYGLIGIMIQLTKFYTYTTMLLSDAVTIHRLSPIFVFFLSGILLKEKINIRKSPLFLFAFLGGILVIKPGFRLVMFPAITALIAAVFIALDHVTLRHLRLTDNYLTITNYFACITG
jgi:drug/metabolite transporter (DMT)-like permease